MSANERVLIVDEQNRPVGGAPRHRMRAERLVHRATFIFVFNSAGQLFVHKRTASKDVFPGYYDLAAGGVVLEGESYAESAAREAAEELGIRDVPLTPRFEFYYEDSDNRCWGQAFTCVHDGPFTLQAEEVESGEFMDLEAALAGACSPVTPDSRMALQRYLGSTQKE